MPEFRLAMKCRRIAAAQARTKRGRKTPMAISGRRSSFSRTIRIKIQCAAGQLPKSSYPFKSDFDYVNPYKKITCEFVGTGFLLVSIVGSGIMGERLSGGSVALA